MNRRFFDWSRPLLPTVARYIVQTARAQALQNQRLLGALPILDLSRLTYILPGRRAIRTLESYLQTEIERAVTLHEIAEAWTPPTFLTIGSAPELLYSRRRPLADRLARLYCERRALRRFFVDHRQLSRRVIPEPPAENNFEAYLQLAQTFLALSDDLASERRDYRQVADLCRERNEHEEALRWDALETLNKLYREEINALGQLDKNIAREEALRAGRIGGTAFDTVNDQPREYRLIGASDLDQQLKDIFNALRSRVQYWVFAPESESERFDQFGCVRSDAWDDFQLPLEEQNLFQVESPADQGRAVALLTMELSKVYHSDSNGATTWRYEPIEPEALTIGAPDDEVAPFIAQALARIGYKSIRGEGESTIHNRVYQLLLNVCEYLETRSFTSLYELIRRPDIQLYLQRIWHVAGAHDSTPNATSDQDDDFDDDFSEEFDTLDPAEDDDANVTPEALGEWLCEFDRYRSLYLPTLARATWRSYIDEDSARHSCYFNALKRAVALLDDALAPFREQDAPTLRQLDVRASHAIEDPLEELKPTVEDFENARAAVYSGELSFAEGEFSEKFRWIANQKRLAPAQWRQIISDFLCRIYDVPEQEDVALGFTRERNHQIDEFFLQFNSKLDSLARLPDARNEHISGASAIRMLLKELAGTTIPPLPDDEVVEVQGWLDLLFDDAPHVILTGFNENVIPSNRSTSLFLPDQTRQALGLRDAQRVYARDAYLINALARSRRNLFIVFGQRTLQGDPLLPSRFAFAVDRLEAPKRIVRFFGHAENDLKSLEERQENQRFPREPLLEEYADAHDATRQASAARVVTPEPGAPSKRFRAPTLALRGKAPDTINVTQFATFLNSPYHYFLHDVYKLAPTEQSAPYEMNAASFGSMAHNVLRDFGLDAAIRDCSNAEEIYAWLSERLNKRSEEFFDELASPFVHIQVEQIRRRLHEFAKWQARWREDGAEIFFVEISPAGGGVLFQPAQEDDPIYLCGRIDRIDYNRRTNTWHVFDYKTFDSPKIGTPIDEKQFHKCPGYKEPVYALEEPERRLISYNYKNEVDLKHRYHVTPSMPAPMKLLDKLGLSPLNYLENYQFKHRWTNLQLPLYRHFFHQILWEYHDSERSRQWVESNNLSLGYIVLPKSGAVEAFGAPWTQTDLDQADNVACTVIRQIRRLWRQGYVEPHEYLDHEEKEYYGKILPDIIKFDDYPEITLSYLKNL
ncbi:MAG: PD-(D/E)XK nuclease family protein [Planctomycetia bacterium]|nr:PD-(D/E)XK nuclease family protein [Planctomycetia bacterium]